MGQAIRRKASASSCDKANRLRNPVEPETPITPSVLRKHIAEHLRPPLLLLQRAYEYAKELRQDSWDFAVAAADLKREGLSDIDLRWLVGKRFVQCRFQTPGKIPVIPVKPALIRGSFVVLTPLGARYAAATAWPGNNGSSQRLQQKPHWDPRTRQLTLGEEIVKELRRPAQNQELVLAAFERSGWAACIDDPLAPELPTEAKKRLHNTINNLNRHHLSYLIRFYANGNGTGIRWALFPARKIR